MPKFVVDLGSYPLDADQHKKMAAAIHTAVLGQLAQHPAPATPMASVATIHGMLHSDVSADISSAHKDLKKAAS